MTYYDQSYPPSLWEAPDATGVVAGSPGQLEPANAAVPANITELRVLGALGETMAWTTGQYIVLGDGSHAYWNGTLWAVGEAP